MRHSSFDTTRECERRAVELLKPVLERRFSGTLEWVANKEDQHDIGDIVINPSDGSMPIWLEIKSEYSNPYGNLFLESFSNKSRGTVGWMYYCRADLLWYCFVNDRELFEVPLRNLKEWAFRGGRTPADIPGVKEKPQKKHNQLNDTWGWPVKINRLAREVPGFTGPIKL